MLSQRTRGFGLPLLLAALATGLAGAVLFWFDPTHCSFYPVCIFHQVTGLQCPGCGTLRALHQLLHGNVASAWHFNSLLVLSLPMLGWWGGRFGWRVLRGEPPAGVRPLWLWCALGGVIAFGIARNLPFAW